MRIEVLIPVAQSTLVVKLLDSIYKNTKQPNGVLLIDNTHDSSVYNTTKPYMDRIPNLGVAIPHHRMSVNESWKWGFSALRSADVISVLNDDLLLNYHFFDMLYETFQKPSVQIACPNTIIPGYISGKTRRRGLPGDIHIATDRRNRLSRLKRREGWAFSIRRSFLETLPPIPNALMWFCGDDWLWHWSVQHGVPWYLMKDNWIWHFVGRSLREWSTEHRRKVLENEKKTLMNILKTQYGYTGPYPSKERIIQK